MQGKITEWDWLRQRAFFLNQDGTFGNQEGMITWCWLAEHACIKLVSRFKWILKRNFQKRIASEFDLNTVISSQTWKKINTQQSAVFWWKSKRIFPTKNVLIRSLKTVWAGKSGVVRRQNFVASKTESLFLRFATSRLISITGLGHLIGVKKNSANSTGTLRVTRYAVERRVLDSRSY